MPENLLTVRGLHKVYGKRDSKFEALRGINLKINRGESVAIVGKSGSGKSTLMHLLALLDRPTKGEIILDGTNTSKLKQRDLNKLRNKEFGFVFQQFFMNANDTVLNNVMLPLKIAGVGVKERRRRAMHALTIVGLESKAKNKASNLSGGQKQRVCIARAIVNDPAVIFADEPTGNLDSNTGAKVEETLFSLNRDKDITLIIVTHDEELAEKCNRQIRISDGRIESDEDLATEREIEAEIAAENEELRKNHKTGDMDADGLRDDATVSHVKVKEAK